MHRLENSVRSYAWGSRSVIADLLGRGLADEPEAELWIGAHPSAPSSILVAGERTDLLDWLRADPVRRLGSQTYARYGARLPYLMKMVAVERPLSLQVHPHAELAAQHYADASSGSWFTDPYHKAELTYAIGEFHAFCGFRTPDDATKVFDRLAHAARAERFADVTRILAAGTGAEALHEACAYIGRLPADAVAGAVGSLPAAISSIDDAGLRAVGELAADHPDDPAVLLCLLLRHRVLEPGETIAIPPGTPHTYLRGTAIEVTTSSDNTLRAGLTSKPTNTDLFVSALAQTAEGEGLSERPAPGEQRFTHHELELSVLSPSPGTTVRWEPAPRVVLALSGEIVLSGTASVRLVRGESAFVPADAGTVDVSGDGRAVAATTAG